MAFGQPWAEGRKPVGLTNRILFQQWGADGIADAKLEVPFFGPGLEFLVLAAFEENGIFPLLEGDGEFVLIDAESAVVFIATEDELAVEPELESVVGA